MADKKYVVIPKKENIGRGHIVLWKDKKYCLHGKEKLSEIKDKEARDKINTNPSQAILKELHDANFSYVKQVDA